MERKLEIVAAMRCYIALEEQRTCGESKNFCRGAVVLPMPAQKWVIVLYLPFKYMTRQNPVAKSIFLRA